MKIQHKRSNQLDGSSAKEPTSDFMEYGELAVNFNQNDPAIFLKDSGDNVIRIAGAGANGNIEIPDAGSDPHQPGTSDDRYVEVTGDNMTGDLTIGPEGGPEVIKLADSGSITAGDSTFAIVRVGTGNGVMSETTANQSGTLRLTAGSADEYVSLNLTNSSTETVGKFTTFGDNCKLDLGKGIPAITLNSNGGIAEFSGKRKHRRFVDGTDNIGNGTLPECLNDCNNTCILSVNQLLAQVVMRVLHNCTEGVVMDRVFETLTADGAGTVYIVAEVHQTTPVVLNKLGLSADGSATFTGLVQTSKCRWFNL